MINSMTGYGRGEETSGGRVVLAEIRSVNHRYCEISLRLHGRCGFAEDAVRQLVKNSIGRGKIDVTISFTSTNDEDSLITLNSAIAKQYFANLRELQRTFDITGEITIDLLASLPDTLRQDRPQTGESAILLLILEATRKALDAFNAMRKAEGAKLQADIETRLDTLAEITDSIGKRAPEVQELHTTKLREKVASLLDTSISDPMIEQRLIMEIALFADKVSIEEELVRLSSHIDQFRNTIRNGAGGETVGKKLDFIVQEMNRETNTIGSKTNDLTITNLMIELKNCIENIREQVQNIA